MSSGGNFFENIANEIADIGVQAATMGYVGYKDGKFKDGIVTEVNKNIFNEVVHGVKEITGANAAEEANKEARKQFEKTQADAENARKEQINQTGRDQLRQSMLAGSAKSSAIGRANRGSSVGGAFIGDERDFLGL